jgi:ribose transport system substrate-binding protein
MKKPFAVLLCMTFALLTSSFAQDDQVVIGVSIPTATHGFMGGLNYWAAETERRVEETYPNVDVVIVSAGNSSEQANDIQDLVAINQIDALVVLPFESDPLTGPVSEVKNQDIFITVVDRGLTDPSIQDLYVSGNNEAFGRVAGEYFAQNLAEGDNIVILRGIPTVIDTQRVDAFMAAIEGSGINVLDSQYANWNRDDAYEVTQDFLTRFPDIDAIWASDDDMAEGVEAAVREAGREGDLFVVGGAGKKEMIQRIMEGDELFPVNVSYSPAQISTAIELTVLNFVSDTPVVGEFLLESVLITPDNAEQFYFPSSPF